MTKRGYKPTPEDAELPEKPPSLPPQVPPRSIPKPKPRPRCGTENDPRTKKSAPPPPPNQQPPQKPPPARPSKCIYRLPFCQPHEWMGNTVPDGEYCHGVGVPLVASCGPDCEDCRAVHPPQPTTQQHPASQLEEHELPTSPKISLCQYVKELYQCGSISGYAFEKLSALIENYNPVQQPHVCTCSQQQSQPRPFVRVGETIIYLDDFSAFGIYFQPDGASVRGLDILGHWVVLLEYGVASVAIELAQSALDAIQSAIEHWNRAATGPRCSCGEPERNVRLVGINRSLSFYTAKLKIENKLAAMGFDCANVQAKIPLQAMWTAIEAVMR